MTYKKLVSLLAISTLALAACDANEEEPTEPENGAVEDENGAEENGTEGASDSQSLIDSASERSGEAFPQYTLTIDNGSWTQEGYVIQGTSIEASAGGEEFSVYLVDGEGTVLEVLENEIEPVFTVDEASSEEGDSYVVGVTPDDLGAEGDSVETEDFARYENVIVVPAAEEAPEE
jgi:hypothetical protein